MEVSGRLLGPATLPLGKNPRICGPGAGVDILKNKEFLVFVAIRTSDFPAGSESPYRSRPWSNLRYWGHFFGETEETRVKGSLRQWFCVFKWWSLQLRRETCSSLDATQGNCEWAVCASLAARDGNMAGWMYYLWQCVHGKGVHPWGKLPPVPSFLPIKKFSFFFLSPLYHFSSNLHPSFPLSAFCTPFLFIFTSLLSIKQEW